MLRLGFGQLVLFAGVLIALGNAKKLDNPLDFLTEDVKAVLAKMRASVKDSDADNLPETNMDAVNLIIYNGYEPQYHQVQTEDGYLLGVIRIQNGTDPSVSAAGKNGIKPAVLLQHGLLASCTSYLTNIKTQALAYVLADAGFDVWLANSRGNVYSRNHIHMSPSDDKFWDFSWDQMAKYDIPAMVDYILKETGNKQIFYVGHSQGTLIAFANFSDPNTDFSKKIAAFFALAPVHTVGHINSPIKLLAPYTAPLDILFSLIGYNDFAPLDSVKRAFHDFVCDRNDQSYLCTNTMMQLNVAKDSTEINRTRVPVYAAHNPAGTSSQNIAHFGQMVNSNKMQKFDYYSTLTNLARYGKTSPPLYDISKMTVPTILFRGSLDVLSDPTDDAGIDAVINKNIVIGNYTFPTYTHCDFIWGQRANQDVNVKIIQHMRDIIATWN
jgi:pimeloyl-ACP methyl ester carboxylesterase